jgi:endonuclease/exonuclease/phosphatase family metal-dependent hydrolase
MRVATFNILHGLSLTDGRVEADRFRAAVDAIDADVLALQEVDRDQPRSHHLDFTTIAAERMAGSGRFVAALLGTPGESYVAATGGPAIAPELHGPQYGIALVSRFPVERWYVHRLPPAPVRSPVLAGPRQVIFLPDEPRVVLAARVVTPAGPVTMATTHLSFVPGWNLYQLRRVLAALGRLPAPRVLLGDLNLPAAVVRRVTRWRPAATLPTFPSVDPRIQLDHILLEARSGWSVDPAAAPYVPLSDHRPLVVGLHP